MEEVDDTCSSCIEEKDEEEIKEQIKEPKPPTQARTYTTLVSFPQCLAKAKLDEQFRNFLEKIKKLYMNIPLIKAYNKCLYTVSF